MLTGRKISCQWLEKGDRNTSFFHAVCTERKRRNKIWRLKKPEGGWEEREEGIQEIISNYFSEIFRSNGANDFQALLTSVPQCVSHDMNASLLDEFKREKIEAACTWT